MKNIYIFNIGPQSPQLTANLEVLKSKDFNVFVGPTDAEHKFLLDHIPYYKRSIEEGIYSFASDVYRFYKLKDNEGLYIDTSLIIGANFEKFWDEVSQYEAWFPKIHDQYLNSPVLFSKKHFLFNEMFEFYKLFDESKSIREFPIGPRTITIICLKHNLLVKDNWEKNIVLNGKVCFDSVEKIRDKETVYKYGGGSWFKKRMFAKLAAKKGWEKMVKEYRNKSTKYRSGEGWKEITYWVDKVKTDN